MSFFKKAGSFIGKASGLESIYNAGRATFGQDNQGWKKAIDPFGHYGVNNPSSNQQMSAPASPIEEGTLLTTLAQRKRRLNRNSRGQQSTLLTGGSRQTILSSRR